MTLAEPTGTPAKRAVLVSLQGKFTSFWKGKPAPDAPPPEPPKTDAPTPPDAAMADAPAMTDEPAMAETPPPPAMDEGTPGTTSPPSPAPAMEDVGPGTTSPPATEPEPSAPTPPPAPPAMEEPPMGEPAPSGPRGPEGEAGSKPADAPEAGKPAAPARLDEGVGTLVVLGDADLVADAFSGTRLDQMQGATQVFNKNAGLVLVPNLVDWMTGSDSLMELRSRTAGVRKLAEISEDKASSIRYANLLAVPILAVIAGLVVYFVRKHGS
jgi:hypothetical protein